MPAPKLSKGKRGCMVFRDHARVGLLWLVVTCPPLVLRSVPLRARLARPSVSTSSSARRPRVVPVAASPCSRSSSRARPPPPLAAFCVLVPHSCALRSARARAGARPVLHCAPHSVCAVSPPPLACASTHAASGARPALAAPRATPSSPVAAPRTSPAALLFYSRPAVCLAATLFGAVHVYTPFPYSPYSRSRLLAFLSWLRCARRQSALLPRRCRSHPRPVAW